MSKNNNNKTSANPVPQPEQNKYFQDSDRIFENSTINNNGKRIPHKLISNNEAENVADKFWKSNGKNK